MATFVHFEILSEDILESQHDFSADTIKIYLTNTAPDAAADEAAADLPAEISAGNGYDAGGETLDSVATSRTGTDTDVTCSDEVLTASGGSIGPFRYAVLINTTSDSVIGYYDLGASYTLNDGDSFTFDFGAGGFLQANAA